MQITAESGGRIDVWFLWVPSPNPSLTHIYAHTSHTCMHMSRPATRQGICITLKLLSFCCPSGSAHTHTYTHAHIQMSHTNADIAAGSVVNRSLPAFHFCSKSIGLCRTQHLIEAHKVTDYWIVTFCTEGCLQLNCKRVAMVAYKKQLDHSSFYYFCSELWTLCWENAPSLCF